MERALTKQTWSTAGEPISSVNKLLLFKVLGAKRGLAGDGAVQLILYASVGLDRVKFFRVTSRYKIQENIIIKI